MFIAHIPAGYISSRLLFSRFQRYGITLGNFLWAGICGAVFPDADLLYFYLMDHRQHPHHSYLTHFPLLWACLALISVAWLYLGRTKDRAVLALIFSLNGLLHMVLDTIVGDIRWLAPFSDRAYALFTVPAVYQPWWLNFFLHWSFGLELLLVLIALYLWRKDAPRIFP